MAQDTLYDYDVYTNGELRQIVGDEITEANEMALIIRCKGVIVFITSEPYTVVNITKIH